MFLLHVIPISRGIGKETLTYFTSLSVSPGALVSVPLRKHIVPALVVDVEDALTAKTKIRSAGHTMRKVDTIISPSAFTPAFVIAAKETANFHATTTGAILARFTTLSFSETSSTSSDNPCFPQQSKSHGITVDSGLLQAERDERFATYRRMIRESFAQNRSVFLLVPETDFIPRLTESLGKGVEDRVVVLHGGLSPNKRAEAWKQATSSSHTLLIIGTGAFLSLPRADIGTIIVEGERSHAYKETVRPHMDIRVFVKAYATHLGARIVYGGLPLRVETLAGVESGSAYAMGTVRTRVTTTANVVIVPMGKKKTEDIPKKKGHYDAVLSHELRSALAEVLKTNRRSVVFSARKGLHSMTVCNDCGHMVACSRCGAPLVLHKTDGEANTHVCHTCGARIPAKDRCAHCNSWKLATIGIGTQYVEEAIAHTFPDATIIRVDGDTATTPTKSAKRIAEFEHTPGAILVTTGIGLLALSPDIPLVAVASMDTLLSFPDFRAEERAVGILATLRMLAGKLLLIQTRNPENVALAFAKDGNLADRYREDLADRKELGYPPFSVLVRITVEGTRGTVDTHVAHIQALLSPWKPHTYAGAGNKKSAHRTHILLKVPATSWPDSELLSKLRSLSPSFDIDINPESVL